MKKLICFFLAVIFVTALFASCGSIKPDETSATTPGIDIISETSHTAETATTTETSNTAAPTEPTASTAEKAATSVPAETTTATESTASTTAETTAPAETTASTTSSGSTTEGTPPPTRIKGVSCANVSELMAFLKCENEFDLERYFGPSFIFDYKDAYLDILSKIAEFETWFFPAFDLETNVLQDKDYPIWLIPESDGRYEILFNIEYDGCTGNFSLMNHTLNTDPETLNEHSINDFSMYVLGEMRTVYWKETTYTDGNYTSSASFRYGDAWMKLQLHNCHYDKLFELLEKLYVLPLDSVKYTSNKALLKKIEEMCVLPTDIGSDDEDGYKDVWFAGDIDDMQNDRTRTFGLKTGKIYFGFDRSSLGNKKIAVNVYAFDTVGTSNVDVENEVLGEYFRSIGIETHFWNDTVTLIIDNEELSYLDEYAVIPGHETYRMGFFLAGLPLKRASLSEKNDESSTFDIIKLDLGEYSLAKCILLEMGDELTSENLLDLSFIIQKTFWKKILKFYGFKDDVIQGYKLLTVTPPVFSAIFVLDEEMLDTIVNTDGYIVQMKMSESDLLQ